ncbi:MAG: hypothetical protein WCO19_00220 [Candidatus Saccharibacteria bacterium]
METDSAPSTSSQKTSESATKSSRTKIPKVGLIIIIGVILGVGSWAMYASGIREGKKQANAEAKKVTAQKVQTNPLLILPSSGIVSKITKDQVEIKLLGTETKSGKIDVKTQISNKTGNTTIADIKEGDKIVLFTKKSGNDDIATRIIIQ